MNDKQKLLEKLKPLLIEITSSEGQKLIQSSKKVEELWWDSEITNTKAGTIYDRRSHFHLSQSFLPKGEKLWELNADKNNKKYLISDIDKVYEIINIFFSDFCPMPYTQMKTFQWDN